MQLGSGDTAPRLLHLATWLQYVVTSHHARSTEGTPTSTEDDASWPQEQTFMGALQYMWMYSFCRELKDYSSVGQPTSYSSCWG
jgi:hypothetical protein